MYWLLVIRCNKQGVPIAIWLIAKAWPSIQPTYCPKEISVGLHSVPNLLRAIECDNQSREFFYSALLVELWTS